MAEGGLYSKINLHEIVNKKIDKGKHYSGAAALNKCSEAELVNKKKLKKEAQTRKRYQGKNLSRKRYQEKDYQGKDFQGK